MILIGEYELQLLRQQAALNAELLAALKDATEYMLKTGNLYPAQAYVKLIAKAEASK